MADMDVQEFAAYQRQSRKTWDWSDRPPDCLPTLGLANEAGEVAGKIKKLFRDKGGCISDADRESLKMELGDVLWYLAQICTELDLDLGRGGRGQPGEALLAQGARHDRRRRRSAVRAGQEEPRCRRI